MKESELREVFLKIANRYSNFVYDDYKVNEWLEILDEVPFELALKNLRAYTLNPKNTWPPHPGALAESMVQRSEGPHIPNAAETRLMLEERDLDQAKAIPMPDRFREELKQLVERNRSE